MPDDFAWLLVLLTVFGPNQKPVHKALVHVDGVFDTGYLNPGIPETDSKGRFYVQVLPGEHRYAVTLPSGEVHHGSFDATPRDTAFDIRTSALRGTATAPPRSS